ncbi:MAG: tyrosine-type recombinase/integrase [Terracidiphilus sp.]
MTINLYRRHRAECEAGHPEQFRSGEFEERRKGWKRCGCLIHASGTLAGKFSRKSTGVTDWSGARELVASWKSWEPEVSAQASAPLAPHDTSAVLTARVTIERTVQAFLATHTESSAFTTQRMYRYLMNRFTKFSESKGYVLLNQWGPMDVREFRTSWGVAANTATKNMTIVKSFFEFAVSNEWLDRNPARLVKELRNRNEKYFKERIPFSDDELARMFEACESKYGKSADEYRYRWSGQDLADFIAVSVYTGLRISDVCTFHMDRLLESGECHIRTTKNGKKVYTWIPTWLQQRIRERAKIHGPLIFGAHQTTDICVVTDVWRRKLLRLWDLCGPWPERPTPHRFRHTFARILLEKANVTVRDVAELLGNTEEIVRKHYAAWVPERQARLTKVLQEAFEAKPKPKLVALRGGRR